VGIKVIIEFQARPGMRDELRRVSEALVAAQGATEPAFLGSTRYEVVDQPDTLIEIAEWTSAEARQAHMQEAAATGVYAPLFDLLAGPVRATVIRPLG
jgi:quinol monooxygenase YgiN